MNKLLLSAVQNLEVSRAVYAACKNYYRKRREFGLAYSRARFAALRDVLKQLAN